MIPRAQRIPIRLIEHPIRRSSLLALGFFLVQAEGAALAQQAMGSAFTYQGQLNDDGARANGIYDLQFTLQDTPGANLGSITRDNVTVREGLFAVTLDFGSAVLAGEKRFLAIGVRPGASVGAFTALTPRQELTPGPMSVYANFAGNAETLDGLGSEGFAAAAHQHDLRYWKLGGNAGSTVGTDFIGTTDEQAFELRVNGFRALRLEPDPSSPNLIGGFGGNSVTAEVTGATIAGGGDIGFPNTVTDVHGAVGGGSDNVAGDSNADALSAQYPTVGGGFSNTASGSYTVVSGGLDNTAGGQAATVGGGQTNLASGGHATVGGGEQNTASGLHSTVGGGKHNRASAEYATIGGGGATSPANPTGTNNRVTDTYGTVSGGGDNQAGDDTGTSNDRAFATVGGGQDNTAGGRYSTVPGGQSNKATGEFSMAAGRQAKAGHAGSFVWADSGEADFASTATNEFAIRASNGLRLSVDAGPATPGEVGRYYRDNAIVAWARVTGAATLSAELGVSSVTRPVDQSTGVYEIVLDASATNSSSLIPVAIAELESPPTSAGGLRIVSIDQVGVRTFQVFINTGTGSLVNNDFIFMVTAR